MRRHRHHLHKRKHCTHAHKARSVGAQGSIRAKHIAFAAHRLQIAGLLGIGLDLAAQAGDLDVNRALLGQPLVAAQILDQLGTADRLAQVLRKDPHQLGFRRRQAHGLVPHQKFQAFDVIARRSQMQHLGRCVFRFRFGHAALNGVDAQQQLLWLKRFGQIIIGSGLQPCNTVLGLAFGVQQQV